MAILRCFAILKKKFQILKESHVVFGSASFNLCIALLIVLVNDTQGRLIYIVASFFYSTEMFTTTITKYFRRLSTNFSEDRHVPLRVNCVGDKTFWQQPLIIFYTRSVLFLVDHCTVKRPGHKKPLWLSALIMVGSVCKRRQNDVT